MQIIDNTYGGQTFNTEREAAIAGLVDFLTAGGLNSIEDALDYHAEGPESNIAEMTEEWGQRGESDQDVAAARQALREAWEDAADKLREMAAEG